MRVLDIVLTRGFACTCDDGPNQSWHERNGGNSNYRIKPEEAESMRKEPSYDRRWQLVGASAPALSRGYLMVSGNGRFIRSMTLEPEINRCIMEVDQTGGSYCTRWGLAKGGRPTSELPTYLMNHKVKMKATEGGYRVIYHAHLANIIALTLVLPLTDEAFTRELREMVTECPVVFLAGIGVVGWMVPGGHDTAMVANGLMEEYDTAVRARHGLFCVDEDFNLTFGLVHTVEKSVKIPVKALSIRPDKLQTVTLQEFRSLTVDFHVNPPEKFLYEKQVESGRLKRQH